MARPDQMRGPTSQRIVMPFAKGLGGNADPRVRPPDHLLKAVNCYADADGLLVKRNGFTKLTRSVSTGGNLDDEGPVRGLAKTDTELLAIGHRTLYAYSPEAVKWIPRGRVSPCTGETRERFRGSSSYRTGDMSVGLKYIVNVAVRSQVQFETADSRAVDVTVRSVNTGEVVHSQAIGATTTGGDYPLKPRVFSVLGTGGATQHFLMIGNSSGAPGTLKIYQLDEAAPFSGFVFVRRVT
jgi:hypothetical protein